MAFEQTQGLVAKKTLTETELTGIKQLTDTCNTYEGLHTRLHFDMLRQRPGNTINDFLYYEQGLLIGYLGLDSHGTKEKEVVGMVSPDHRRKGIFSRLLHAAKEESKRRDIEKLVLICERSSASGQAFIKARNAHLNHSEHEMVLGTFRQRAIFDDHLIFRQANRTDAEMIAFIMATDMDDDIENARRYTARVFERPEERFFVATLGEESVGCQEPIGSLRLIDMKQQVGIYGFVVRPEYRGRGYGRQMLQETIQLIQAESSQEIMLDVDVDNTNALGLYLSCGFEIKTTYDYYDV